MRFLPLPLLLPLLFACTDSTLSPLNPGDTEGPNADAWRLVDLAGHHSVASITQRQADGSLLTLYDVQLLSNEDSQPTGILGSVQTVLSSPTRGTMELSFASILDGKTQWVSRETKAVRFQEDRFIVGEEKGQSVFTFAFTEDLITLTADWDDPRTSPTTPDRVTLYANESEISPIAGSWDLTTLRITTEEFDNFSLNGECQEYSPHTYAKLSGWMELETDQCWLHASIPVYASKTCTTKPLEDLGFDGPCMYRVSDAKLSVLARLQGANNLWQAQVSWESPIEYDGASLSMTGLDFVDGGSPVQIKQMLFSAQ